METAQQTQLPFVRKPAQDIRFRRSKDGKYILVDIIQTWLFSTKYFEALAQNTKSPKEVPANI